MTDRTLTQEYVLECFDYQDGSLYWRQRPPHHFGTEKDWRIFNSRQCGSKAGALWGGYVMVNFSGCRIGVHRLVFLMFHGFLPQVVDHINGVPWDNRLENLRAASRRQNMQNIKTPKTNSSGRKGVSWNKGIRKWSAGIRCDGRWKYLGSFERFEDACAVRSEAELAVYGEFANAR